MLNLSDKELDRLSKEAAQEYEPGDVLGSRSWEKLDIRLGRDLGRVNPNPLRHIRRFPFYYAPALLVLVGISYFLLRHGGRGSGSSPGEVVRTVGGKNVSSPANTVSQNKSTSTPATSSTVPSYPTPSADGGNGDAGKGADRVRRGLERFGRHECGRGCGRYGGYGGYDGQGEGRCGYGEGRCGYGGGWCGYGGDHGEGWCGRCREYCSGSRTKRARQRRAYGPAGGGTGRCGESGRAQFGCRVVGKRPCCGIGTAFRGWHGGGRQGKTFRHRVTGR